MLFAIFLFVGLSEGFPRPESKRAIEPKQLILVSGQQQYNPNIQYDFPILEPQFQLPTYNFINDKPFPRIQPQLLLYPGGAHPGGQPFLLQPGSPPGNFLVPQPGPNVIFRDNPQRPVFVAGYPKPAHIPPTEKDAEEIPTNPAKIPPIPSGRTKPEKLETFNEPEPYAPPKKHGTEADVLAAADRNPFFTGSLKPGQRFFILNGQSLFSNYPYQIYPESIPDKYSFQNDINTPQDNINNFLLRNNPYDNNFILQNNQREAVFRSALPLSIPQEKNEEKAQFRYQAPINDNNDNYEDDDNDSVIIDAREEISSDDVQKDSEQFTSNNEDEKSAEPTISQAQPAAIALAGPGGVAAASPRGNAFVGKGGVALSSPQATAVAGPSKEDKQKPDKKIPK